MQPLSSVLKYLAETDRSVSITTLLPRREPAKNGDSFCVDGSEKACFFLRILNFSEFCYIEVRLDRSLPELVSRIERSFLSLLSRPLARLPVFFPDVDKETIDERCGQLSIQLGCGLLLSKVRTNRQ